jgi:hypothetical protein
MQNQDVLNGMRAASFVFDVLAATPDAPRVRLSQNTPNPFRLSTTIRFALERPGHVKLEMFDLAGRQVATLLDGARPAGDAEVDFDPRGLPGGVYFYRLSTPDGASVRRCVVLR